MRLNKKVWSVRNVQHWRNLCADDGITCAGFVSNPIVANHSYLPLGFNPFVTTYVGEDEGDARLQRKDAVNLVQDAVEYLRAAPFPLFLYHHFMDTHEPLNPDYVWDPKGTARNLSEFMMNQYDGCIRHVDEQIGVFFNALKTSGHWDDSLIVVTADHGEHLGKRHHIRGHGKSVYEELIRVPLLIKYPHMKKGIRIKKMTDLRYVYHLLRNPETADLASHTSSTLLSETLHNLPGHERNDTYESIAASREDGLKLISYFECNPNGRPWELFKSPAPGQNVHDVFARWRLAFYEKSNGQNEPPVYQCKVMERRQEQETVIVEYLPSFSFPVESLIDPEWNTLVDVNQLTGTKGKNCLFMYGALADQLYEYFRKNVKEKTIKLETIDLTALSVNKVDGEFLYQHTVEYSVLVSDQPLPTNLEETMNFKAFRQKGNVSFTFERPLISPFFLTGSSIALTPMLCLSCGRFDGMAALDLFQVPKWKKLWGFQDEDSLLKQIYIRKEDYSETKELEKARYGVYGLWELAQKDLESTNIDPSFGRLYYLDYGFTGDALRMFQSARLRIPRFLVNYYYSLDMTLLHSMIQNSLKDHQQLVGFEIQDVLFDESSNEWIYQLNVVCAQNNVYPFSKWKLICSKQGIEFLPLQLNSSHHLIGHINGNPTMTSSWFFPAEKEIQRKELVTALNRAMIEKMIPSLNETDHVAFVTLLSQIDAYIEESGEVGNPLDQLEGVSDETLRALGYIN